MSDLLSEKSGGELPLFISGWVVELDSEFCCLSADLVSLSAVCV